MQKTANGRAFFPILRFFLRLFIPKGRIWISCRRALQGFCQLVCYSHFSPYWSPGWRSRFQRRKYQQHWRGREPDAPFLVPAFA